MASIKKPPQLMSGDAPKPRRRLLSRWDWLWLILVALILLYVLSEKFGVPIVTKSESEELIQHPHRQQ